VNTGFQLFGPAHLLILAAVPALAIVLSRAARKGIVPPRALVFTLGVFLAVNELFWYAFRLSREGFRFPEGLPLHLCDFMLWLTVAAALTLNRRVFEVAWFAGIGGASMALLTPDLWAPLASYPTIYFFLAHGFVVVTLLTLLGSGQAALRPGCVWRAFAIVNAYAAAVGIFNLIYGTNYMYLCRKPPSASLLDYLGPWPVYVLAGEAVALAAFWLLYLPVRRRG